jgi:hypothetical protein
MKELASFSLRERLAQYTASSAALSVLFQGMIKQPASHALFRVRLNPHREEQRESDRAVSSSLQFLLQPSCFRVAGERGGGLGCRSVDANCFHGLLYWSQAVVSEGPGFLFSSVAPSAPVRDCAYTLRCPHVVTSESLTAAWSGAWVRLFGAILPLTNILHWVDFLLTSWQSLN